MTDREGDPEKKTPECRKLSYGRFMLDPNNPGHWIEKSCPNIHEVSSANDFDGETYDCTLCGEHYRLYYDEMQ